MAAFLPAQEHTPPAMHKLTPDLLQFLLCLFLPLPILNLLALVPEVTPGTDTERALVSAGAQHGLGGSRCGGSWHSPLDAAHIHCLATLFLPSFLPGLSHTFLALRKGTEAATSRNRGLRATRTGSQLQHPLMSIPRGWYL